MSQAPITRRKLYQEVQDRLLQRITAGEIRAGEQLPSERELMEFYGVGRVAVREALQELARSGIVEISHGERARVVVPTARLLIQQHFIERDMQFHREIARISGNPIFSAIVEAMFGWANEHHRSIVRAPGAESVTLAEHERIVQAIEQHDPDAAERAMRDHLSRVSDLYRRATDTP